MIGLSTNAARSYPFDVRQFHRMAAAGIFDDQKVELVAGKIYPMTDLPPHTFAVGEFREALRPMLPRDIWTIREEKPVLIGRYWAPKPDIAVLFGTDAIYAARHPRPRDVALIVEVSDTTYRRDRGQKTATKRHCGHSDLHDCSSQGRRHAHRSLDRTDRSGQDGPLHRCGPLQRARR